MSQRLAQEAPNGFSETSAAYGMIRASNRGGDSLERLCLLAAALLGAETTMIVLNVAGRASVVASRGARAAYVSFAWNPGTGPIHFDSRFYEGDVAARPELREAPLLRLLEAPRFAYWSPIAVAGGELLGLLIADPSPRDAPTDSDLALLDDLANLIGDEFAMFRDLLLDPDANVTVALPLGEILARAERDPSPTLTLDSELRVVSANPAAAALSGFSAARAKGLRLREISAVAVDTFDMVLKRALDTKLSTGMIEIIPPGDAGRQRKFWIRASPFSPIGTDQYFLKVDICDATRLDARQEGIDERIGRVELARSRPPDTTAKFLLETLVRRRSLRSRGGVTYLTLRSWRSPIRDYQLGALKAIKSCPDAAFVDAIAADVEAEVLGLLGGAAFATIVPVPCGHSADAVCLSTAIARSLSQRLNLPVMFPLEARKQKGRSHPKTNASRPPLTLRHPVAGQVHLVDDVATSGAHLEEAAKLLRQAAQFVLPVAWIGGDVAATEPMDRPAAARSASPRT